MVDTDNRLTALVQTAYDSEDLFQRLLADHPAVLSDVSGPGEGGSLLLIRREAPVPEHLAGSGRWSLDHLFVDQDAVPVLVEIKRSTDTRARREVVAQMLDYAANGVAYWPIEHLIDGFNAASATAGLVAEERLADFLGDREPDAFWKQVEANLRSGRIRMVIVADKIAPELRRIVEFLNEQMRPAEMLALEVDQHMTPDGMRLLTPRLVGATERAATAKSIRPSEPILDVEAWLADFASRHGEVAGAAAAEAAKWFIASGFDAGVTSTQDSLYFKLTGPDEKAKWPFFIRRSNGRLETSLQYLKNTQSFASDDARADLLTRIKSVAPTVAATPKLTGWPGVPLSSITDEGVWEHFKAIANSVAEALRARG